MKTLEIFKLLRKHRKLAEKRALDYEQNKFAKVMAYIGVGFVVIYLVGIAIMLASIANDARTVTSIEMIFSLLPFLLIIDFSLRFIAQKTPSQIIKPYVLTPLPRYACIDSFLANSLLSEGNFIWFFLFVPYALMSVVFSFGLWQTLAMLFLLALVFLANSQWYLLARTKINDSLVWWALPAAVILLIASPIFLAKDFFKGIDDIADLWAKIGTCIHDGNPLPFIVTIALLVALIAINRKMQCMEGTFKDGADQASYRVPILLLGEIWGDRGVLEVRGKVHHAKQESEEAVYFQCVLRHGLQPDHFFHGCL